MNDAQQWQLRGKAPDIYDQYIAPAVAAPWYPLLMATGRAYMAGPIADIGCGTGSLLAHVLQTQTLAPDTVLRGIDLNPAMLDVAASKAVFAPYDIRWQAANAEHIPLADQYCQLVYCQQGIQYFSDKAKALAEMQRITQAQGALLATVWSDIEHCIGYQALATALQQVIGDRAQASSWAPFSFANPTELNTLAQQAGFASTQVRVIDNVVRFPSIEAFACQRIYSSPLANDLPVEDIDSLIQSVSQLLKVSLRAYQNERGFIFPVKANVLLARPRHESN